MLVSHVSFGQTEEEFRANLLRLQEKEQEIAKQHAELTKKILRLQRTTTIITVSFAAIVVGAAVFAWAKTGKFQPPTLV